MAFNINTFKEEGLLYGGARPSLFSVQFNTPPGVALNAPSLRKFTFTCRAAELPPSTVGTIEVPYFGRKVKVAGERSYSDWTVTVINDEDFGVRTMFESWHNFINTAQSNLRLANPLEGYKTDVLVTQFSKDGTVLIEYRLHGAYPAAVSGIQLSWESANAIEEFTVGFAYDYWVAETQTNSTQARTNISVYNVAATTTEEIGANVNN